MKSVPKVIDGAKVVLFTSIDERHRPTGNCKHVVDGLVTEVASGLAICKYENEDGFYLFSCDQDWNSIADTFHETIDEAKAQAEFEYEGVSASWEQMS